MSALARRPSSESEAVRVSSPSASMENSGATPPGLHKALGPIWRSLSGVTLIELLIVVAVLAVLAMVGYPTYTGIVVKARETAAVAYMAQWPTAQLLYYTDRGRFATSLNELYDAGYLAPADSSRIGYTFEITQFVAGAPPPDKDILAFAGAPTTEPLWESIGLVTRAWANGKDKEENKKKGKKKKDEKDKDKEKDKKKDKKGKQKDNDKDDPFDEDQQSSGGEVGWQGYADPDDERPRHFYTDHNKEVRFAKGRRATRHDPKVHIKNKKKNKGKASSTKKSGKI